MNIILWIRAKYPNNVRFDYFRKQNILENHTLEKSQALTLHLKMETSFASMQVNTAENLYWTLDLHISCFSLTLCTLNFIIDAKACKKDSIEWPSNYTDRTQVGSISEQVPDCGRQEKGVYTQVKGLKGHKLKSGD